MYCQKCGKEVQENTRFCFNCGTPLTAPVTAPIQTRTYKTGNGKTVALVILSILLSLSIIFNVFLLLIIGQYNKFEEYDPYDDFHTNYNTNYEINYPNSSITINARFKVQTEDGTIVLTEHNILNTSMDYDGNNCYNIKIILDYFGSQCYKKATSEHTGETLEVYVDNELICSPYITATISDGFLLIPCENLNDAHKLNNKLRNIM